MCVCEMESYGRWEELGGAVGLLECIERAAKLVGA